MTFDVEKLRALAEAATPGSWRVDDDRICDGLCGDPVRYHDGSCCDHASPIGCYIERHRDCGTIGREIANERDAAFITAAGPQTILALLDKLDGFRAPEAHWTCQQKIDDLEEQLAAMTAARDEACDIIDDPNGAGGGAEEEMAPYRRATELRKIGKP